MIIDGSTLRTNPQTLGEHNFKIVASTIAGQMASRIALLDVEHVCTPTDQVITPVSEDTLVLQVTKNTGLQEMITAAQVEAMF